MTDAKDVLIFGPAGGDFDLLSDKQSRAVLPVEVMRRNLENFLAALQDLLPAADKPAAGRTLKTITVAVGVNAKGEVGFLGTGAEVGGSATLTLTFER